MKRCLVFFVLFFMSLNLVSPLTSSDVVVVNQIYEVLRDIDSCGSCSVSVPSNVSEANDEAVTITAVDNAIASINCCGVLPNTCTQQGGGPYPILAPLSGVYTVSGIGGFVPGGSGCYSCGDLSGSTWDFTFAYPCGDDDSYDWGCNWYIAGQTFGGSLEWQCLNGDIIDGSLGKSGSTWILDFGGRDMETYCGSYAYYTKSCGTTPVGTYTLGGSWGSSTPPATVTVSGGAQGCF